MQVSYKIFSKWQDLDNLPESKHFMCYQTSTGKIIAFDYEDMRRLFLLNSKADIINANVKILNELEDALSTGKFFGVIEV